MEITANIDHFENALIRTHTGESNPVIDQLISEMVLYARSIPPGKSLKGRPRPVELKSIEFKAIIDQESESIRLELLALLRAFLAYIETVEPLLD